MDLLYSEARISSSILPMRGADPGVAHPGCATVRLLERIADHGVDIGGRTVFLVTGERMESAMRQYRERRVESTKISRRAKGHVRTR